MSDYFLKLDEPGPGARGRFRDILPILPARAPRGPGRLYAGGLKRALDVALVLAAAPFAAPLVLALALWIGRDGGPAFYAQSRIGRRGRSFRCWKLRTMVPDAEARLAAHLAADPAAAAEWAADRKLRRDPRVTAFGEFLRRSSLDELPQLWNVLVGEMSLVGPRPVTAGEMTRYGETRAAYCSVRPGLTGLWQVSGRNALSYERRVALDGRYVRELSLFTDAAILFKTIGVVFDGDGC